MNWKEWLLKWDMTYLKFNAVFAELEFSPKDSDRNAAWELYIELLTRITTQQLLPDHGDEQTALDSVFTLFEVTRDTLKRQGRQSGEFAKLAIVVLNQIVRPFTAKWHRLALTGAFEDVAKCEEFRSELNDLQQRLRTYSKMLADMAGVEDLTALESSS